MHRSDNPTKGGTISKAAIIKMITSIIKVEAETGRPLTIKSVDESGGKIRFTVEA